jgi:hypothetical protein
MKAQILKIAGVKSEKEFYKKYPSEEAFMSKHRKAFKKAQIGAAIPFEQSLQGLDTPDWYQDAIATTTDTTTLSPIAFDINKFGINPQTLGKTTAPTTTQAPTWNGSMFKTPGIPTQEYANQKQISGEGELQRIQDSTNQQKNVTPQMNPVKGIPLLGSVIGGIADINAATEANRYKKQTGRLLDLENIALTQRPNLEEHKYDTPWANVTDANTRFPTQGVGSNVLAAKNGTSIGGNATEIQNTYGNGNSLYDDLGYEPLGDSDISDEDIVKQYRSGGFVSRAQFGFDLTSAGEGIASGGASSGGGKIGAGIGSFTGEALGDKSGIGSILGAGIGAGLDMTTSIGRDYDRANQQKMAGIQANIMGKSLGQMYGGNRKNGGDVYSYEEGGYLNPEYNPQLIAMFGDHNAQDFADYAHKDEFRSGGHLVGDYEQPSPRALETMALGGSLKTTWGGVAKPISYNPFMDGTGETVNFYGQKHSETDGKGNSGIGVKYGDGGQANQYAEEGADIGSTDVEVEQGEPGWESIDRKTGQKHLNILGNLELNKNSIGHIEDEEVSDLINKYNGQKFKNIAKKISKGEVKATNVVESAIKNINTSKPKTQIDKIKDNSFNLMKQSGIDKLKNYAGEKENLVALQSTINETAEEQGVDADHLAKKGEVKPLKKDGSRKARLGASIMQAKNGTKIPIAQDGYSSKYGITPWQGNVQKGNKYGKATASGFSTKQWDEVADKLGFKGKGNKEFQEFLLQNKESAPLIKARHQNLYGKDPFIDPEHFGYGWAANELLLPKAAEIPADTTTGISTTATPLTPVEPNKRKLWMDIVNQAIPYLRTKDTEQLDPNQLTGEYYALANNQLEPVQAQGFQPELGTPYDISLQDQLNANQADFRSIQKMTGYNPAAQANLAAQKYAANSKVLGEQFRLNQAEKDKVYDQNRQLLNQAKLQNLAIYDKQYERQAQAKSNTKATTQAALSSISDKFAKNKLENRTLQTYENMYNYRFNKDFKAINENPLAQFDTTVTGAGSPTGKSTDLSEYEKAKAISNAYESKVKKDIKNVPVERNGGIVKEFKNL